MFEKMPWDEYRDTGDADEGEQSCVREVPCCLCGEPCPPAVPPFDSAVCHECRQRDAQLGEQPK